MNKCGRCGKIVYPTEELKCLDKLWHKGCFKCNECGMTLNMKNYKGYNKMPYCNAHCPQIKPTTVADTPEIRRLAETTRNQSQVKYHEDFEKAKGKLTQVAVDPETMRILNASKIISNVAYHGDLEKKRQMEGRRALLSNDSNRIDPTLHQLAPEVSYKEPITSINPESLPVKRQQAPLLETYRPKNMTSDQNENISSVPSQFSYNGPTKVIGDNLAFSSKQSTLIYNSEQGSVHEPTRKIGSIADYDPLNHNYGSIASGFRNEQQQYSTYYGAPSSQAQAATLSMTSHSGAFQPNPPYSFTAIYDYSAQDLDEVSFNDGDMIINCVPIDEGWMTGTVQRTGQRGMLPANYVKPLH